MKAIKAKLEEQGKKEEEVKAFQKAVTDFVKHLVSKISEIQFFTGESNNYEAGLAYCYQKEQTDPGPTFYFFNHGLR